MNIILLSGGSGKRLWPLSTEERSKQFIPLFNDGDSRISMVQRMYRSIKRVDKDAHVLIATGANQVDILKEQLGNDIHVSIEPARKDTFAAICLSVLYLHDVMGVKSEESVIVCPVDPYVDDDYFEALKKLDELVKEDKANLTLIGINPTSPATKYGYILPVDKSDVSAVKRFQEKPKTEDIASSYIAEGALWNAGVFGFKVGYMLEKASGMLGFDDYKSMYDGYSDIPVPENKKFSIDYMVVEKEPSIRVMRFNGTWEDLGSYATIGDILKDDVTGSGIIHESKGSKIINESNAKVVINGVDDIIVAVTKEGIYVTKKDVADKVKDILSKSAK